MPGARAVNRSQFSNTLLVLLICCTGADIANARASITMSASYVDASEYKQQVYKD
jgi:hypothetical protein